MGLPLRAVLINFIHMQKIKWILLTVIYLSVYEAGYTQGFLSASGTKIVNARGENVLLRGIGLGGWMLQEGYMLRLNGHNPQYSIRNKIAQLVGVERMEQFYNDWRKNFITKADIDSLRAWGFNSVRLPMHYKLYTLPVEQEPDSAAQTWLKTGFEMTDSLLSWCKANQLYLILDLHAAPGGQGNDVNISDRDSTQPSLWQSPAAQLKTIALWRKLAERYRDEPAIGAYDILNEPNWGFEDPADRNGLKESQNKPLRDLLIRITDAIRSADKQHIIIIEGNGWGNNYRGVFPLWDSNMVISYHKYWNTNTQESIRHILEAREQQHAPVWLGETGENSNTWFAEAIRLLEEANIGWSWWPLKKMGSNNPLEIYSNKGYDKLLDYWNHKTVTPPSADTVEQALAELAAATHIRNNRIATDVIDALFRQPFSAAALPYTRHWVRSGELVIPAVQYDLGCNRVAYLDKDTGNYSNGKGPRSTGNRGRCFRNDGVDIYKDPDAPGSFYVGDMENEEWLQYTIEVNKTGSYSISMLGLAHKPGATLALELDGKVIAGDILLASDWAKSGSVSVKLKTGKHVVRVLVKQEGGWFKSLHIHGRPG